MQQVIVIGGGLSGLSAAQTVVEEGINVLVIDKSEFFDGNGTKATSGINGALTRTQQAHKIQDIPEIFKEDCMRGGASRPELVNVLCDESAPAVGDSNNNNNNKNNRNNNNSVHRGKERFPGMTITDGVMEQIEEIVENSDKARIMLNTKATKLVKDKDGHVCGVEAVTKDGKTIREHGPVIIATGGFGADFADDSLLGMHRPDLMQTQANGDHCIGDGLKMTMAVGGECADLECVQVHPTGTKPRRGIPRAAWDPTKHPRDARGRFVKKNVWQTMD